jgi:hypothetical protein
MNWVQSDQAVQNVLNDWNYLNELNSAKVQANWPPFDLTQGGEHRRTATGEACSSDVISGIVQASAST